MHPMSLALSATIRANAQPDDVAATLIIHNGQPEPCFTATEVRAMLGSMRSVAVSQRIGIEQYEDVCKKHGITLDPA